MTPPSPCPHKTRVAMTDGLKPFCNECESEKDVAINKANEKNWYNSLDWYYETKFGHIVPDLPRIVAEAERRGREAAWIEAADLIDAHSDFTDNGVDVHYSPLSEAIDTKLTELKKV